MAAGGGGAGAAAYISALKAMGTVVTVEPNEFLRVLARSEDPLVVTAMGGLFRKHHQYVTAYKGLVFHTKSPEPFPLEGAVELVRAKRIWVPHM
jgi:hypothetical protein